jgi:hypothetical protein
MPMMPPAHGFDISTPMSCRIPKIISTVAGTDAKKPGLYTSTRRIRAPATMSSHPKDNPKSGSTMFNDQSVWIKWYWGWLAENGLKTGNADEIYRQARGEGLIYRIALYSQL